MSYLETKNNTKSKYQRITKQRKFSFNNGRRSLIHTQQSGR